MVKISRKTLFARNSAVILVICAGICVWPASLRAELYQWTDPQGRVHFTDDLSQVPASQRAKAARSDAEDTATRRHRWNAVEVPSSVHRAAEPRDTAAKPGQRHVLRVERGGESMVVIARLNGEVNVPFVADTGAMGCTVPLAAVEAAGIRIDEATPRKYVTGISGQPMSVPVVTFDEVRVGTAMVRNVEMAVLDTMQEGLLGMTFFNHFKVETDPMSGTLTLEEIDVNAIDGIYGGHSRSYWQRRFRALEGQLTRVRQLRKETPSSRISEHERLDRAEASLVQQNDDLHMRASAAGVPREWRE